MIWILFILLSVLSINSSLSCKPGKYLYEDNCIDCVSGQYCINNTVRLCNPGYYCPDITSEILCKSSHYCVKGSDRQLDCIDINNKKRNELIIINNSKKDVNNLNNLFNILV